MRRAADIERREPVIAADAVLGMNDNIARLQGRDLGDELIVIGAAPRRPRQALAKHVLLGDQHRVLEAETMLDREHREAERIRRQATEIIPARHGQRLARAVLFEQRAQPLARAGAVSRDQHALAGRELVFKLRLHDVEKIARRIGARRREINAGFGAAIGRIGAAVERRKLHHCAGVEELVPFLRVEKKLLRLDRAIDHRAFDRAGIASRGVEIVDRFLSDRCARHRIDDRATPPPRAGNRRSSRGFRRTAAANARRRYSDARR